VTRSSAAGRPLQGHTVLAVFAHPDDESLACGGTLARLSDAGARVVLMCASRGERGSVSDPALVPDGDLAGVRTRELQEAAAVLGIADVIVLDHPDGDLRWAHVPQLHAEIVAAVEQYQPDAVITFAEDGLYWHLDHIGVHERTYTALRSLTSQPPALYYVTMVKGIMPDVVRAAHAKGGAPTNSSFWGIAADAFGDAAKPPSIAIDVRDWVARKLAALRCHKTQMGPNNPIAWIDEDEARRLLGTEYFRREGTSGMEALEALGEPVLETAVPETALKGDATRNA
jgi:N-acetyl-1-D-myo-inositol-2-amino-2-deoxy-alpha-D-glucopyranoside deacetylase